MSALTLPSPSIPHAFPPRDVQRARAELGRMQERLADLGDSERFCADLRAAAAEAAPARCEESAWPSDIQELADKIARLEHGWCPGGLAPGEDRVRNKDRQMLKGALPPGIQVNMDDPAPLAGAPGTASSTAKTNPAKTITAKSKK